IFQWAIVEHHDPVKLLRATAHSTKAIKQKETASVAVCCEIAIGLRPGRLGRLKKLAFLQEHDDRFSAADAKCVVGLASSRDNFVVPFLDLLFPVLIRLR